MKTTAKGTLLIVDGDPTTRRVAEVGLRHAGYRVTIAGSPEQALWFLERASPDAVLTTVSFDGEPLGWDLVRILRSRPDGARMAVIVLMIDPSMRTHDTANLADDLVAWPAGVRELELRVRQALVRRQIGMFLVGKGERRLLGDLADLSPIDLLTLIERSHTTGTLEVEAPRGPATLWFSGGRVIDAHFGRFVGQEAIFQLLIADAAEFEWTIAPIAHASAIESTMADTIAENLRRLDEWTRLCDELPDLDTALRVDPQRLGGSSANLPAEQVALVERCNGRRSIREVIEGSEFDPLLALEVLRNLLQAGLLAPADRAAPASDLVDVGELPPLPAFPEPFPGTSDEMGLDTPLVSGIPEDLGDPLGDLLDEELAARPRDADRRGEVEASPRPAASAAYVFRPPGGAPPQGDGAPSPVPDRRRHESVRIPLVDGRVEPPAGIRQADATGEFTLADRAQPQIVRRRQSILFRRIGPLALAAGRPNETVRSSRHDVMSPSGLISAGELVVEDSSATEVDGLEGAGVEVGEAPADHGSGEPTGRWAAAGPERLLLPESLDDLGRLSAMAAQLAAQLEPGANTPAPREAPAAPRTPPAASRPQPGPPGPLLRPPEPVEEALLSDEFRRRGGLLVIVCLIVLVVVVALRRPAATPEGPAAAPAEPERLDGDEGAATGEAASAKAPVAPARLPGDGDGDAAAPPAAPAVVPAIANAAADADEPPAVDASERDGVAAAALFTRARALYRVGKLNRARRAVDRALELDPRHAEALVLRANIWLEQGMLTQALAAARRATESDPTLAEAYLTLGVIAQEKRAWSESLAAYERYLELAPEARYAQSVRRQVKKLRRKLP